LTNNGHVAPSTSALALEATRHCLTGCAIDAFPFAYAANRWLIGRGRGHGVVHGAH
jgi:hypothetical protein